MFCFFNFKQRTHKQKFPPKKILLLSPDRFANFSKLGKRLPTVAKRCARYAPTLYLRSRLRSFAKPVVQRGFWEALGARLSLSKTILDKNPLSCFKSALQAVRASPNNPKAIMLYSLTTTCP